MASIEDADAAELLQATETVRRRTRAARRSFWFPLALFGLVVVASGTTCRGGQDGYASTANSMYWFVVGGGAYATVFWFYRSRPVRTEVRPYVGIGALVLWMALGFYVPLIGDVLSRALFRHVSAGGDERSVELVLHLVSVTAAGLLGLAGIAWLHRWRRTTVAVAVVGAALSISIGGLRFLPYDVWSAGSLALASALVAGEAARLHRRTIAWTAGVIAASAVIIGVFPTLFGEYYVNFPAAVLFGYDIIPTAAPVAAIAVGLLVLAILVRSPWLAIAAVTVGVLAVCSGLYIIDNFLSLSSVNCSFDMAAIGMFMLACSAVAALAEHRRLASL